MGTSINLSLTDELRAFVDANYDYSLDYRRPLQPAMSDEQAKWVETIMALE